MLVTLAFAIAGLALVGFALVEIGQALGLGDAESIIVRFNRILYSIGLLNCKLCGVFPALWGLGQYFDDLQYSHDNPSFVCLLKKQQKLDPWENFLPKG